MRQIQSCGPFSSQVADYRVYFEEGHKMPRKFLANNVYAEAIESFVVYCADIIVINRHWKTFYLVKRCVKPVKDWWWFGGRILAGEKEIDAARRLIKRETSLDLPPERFSPVGFARYFCKDREQEPQNVGCDSLTFQFTIELSLTELKIVAKNLDVDEYDKKFGLQQFERGRIIADGLVSPVLDLYDKVFP